MTGLQGLKFRNSTPNLQCVVSPQGLVQSPAQRRHQVGHTLSPKPSKTSAGFTVLPLVCLQLPVTETRRTHSEHLVCLSRSERMQRCVCPEEITSLPRCRPKKKKDPLLFDTAAVFTPNIYLLSVKKISIEQGIFSVLYLSTELDFSSSTAKIYQMFLISRFCM